MSIREWCGLFGVFGHERAVQKTYYGLFALQHRGEESAGIAAAKEGRLESDKGMGLVGDVFDPERLERLSGGSAAIGHVRYSTTGSSSIMNAQPIVVRYRMGSIAVAHNGNLVNSKRLRDRLEATGSIFQTTNDSEVIVHTLARPSEKDFLQHLLDDCLRQLKGAFSLIMLTGDSLIGVRDVQGFRPLCLGKVEGAWCLGSETCAFDLVGAEFVRDVEPGEVVVIDENGLSSHRLAPESSARCIFEHVYFARPDSRVFGQIVHEVRKRMGHELAREHPVEADLVVPVPDSGNAAAIGYSQGSGIPHDAGFIRNHYVGRTFIMPDQGDRTESVGIKLNVIPEVVRDKRIVVVDDSVVRGTTARSRVHLLREAGAKEVHLRISCPPIRHPCHYGIDFPTPEELIANRYPDLDALTSVIGADTLGYLSLEGLLRAVRADGDQGGYCTACYSGDYPVPVADASGKYVHEQETG